MANKKQMTAAPDPEPSKKSFLEECKEDPAFIGLAYTRQGKNSRYATPSDIFIVDGKQLDNKALFLTVTRGGCVIIKEAKAQAPRNRVG